MKIKIILTFYFLLLYGSTYATILKGKVVDKDNNPIAFALVRADSTTFGTTTNENGQYLLELPEGQYNILCEYMGYKLVSKNIYISGYELQLNFQLVDQEYTLDEVVINSKEDPAIRKMREVIKRRKQHAKLIKTLETEIYLKGVLGLREMPKSIFGQEIDTADYNDMGLDKSGKGIVYLLEQVSTYSYQAPDKEHTQVHSVKVSGDDQGVGFAQMPPIINIYDNNIQVFNNLNGRGFISPANQDAFYYYNFKFEGTFFENDKMISKIRVTPKRKYEPTFTGFVYVVEDDWMFKSVDLTLTKSNGINILDSLTLKQTYTIHKGNLWIVQSQNIVPVLDMMGFVLGGNFITNYKNTQLNKPINPAKFSQKIISNYDTNALNKTTNYWDTSRAIPLTREEVRNYEFKDSIAIIDKEKADSLKNKYKDKLRLRFDLADLAEKGPGISYNDWRLNLNSLLYMLQYNTVEGTNLTITPQLSYKSNTSKYSLSYTGRYGWKSKQYYQKAQFEVAHVNNSAPSKKWHIAIDGGHYISDISQLMPLSEYYNTFTTLLYGGNYLKFYEKRFIQSNWKQSLGNGFDYGFQFIWEDRTPLYNTTHFIWRKQFVERLTPNNPESLPVFVNNKATILEITGQYQPGWRYIQYPDKLIAIPSNLPILSAAYTKGVPKLFGSDADFDKWRLGISQNISMRMAGYTQYNILFGGFLNKKKVHNPDYIHFIGNQISLAAKYLHAFQLAPYYRFSHTKPFYTEGHLEWHLSGLLTNKIPVINRLNWHLVTGSNALFIDRKNYYTEVFVGFENIGWSIFRFLRLDAVWGYESGLEKPSFGIRLGVTNNIFQITTNE